MKRQRQIIFASSTQILPRQNKNGKSNCRKNDEELKGIVEELKSLAIEDGETSETVVMKGFQHIVAPICRYNVKIGDDAKRTMRKGFYRSKRMPLTNALNVEYPVETASFDDSGFLFSDDRNLLDVPRDETCRFFKERIDNLKLLLRRIPKETPVLRAQELRHDVQQALYAAYELYPQAVDLEREKNNSNLRRFPLLKNLCQELANAGEIDRLNV